MPVKTATITEVSSFIALPVSDDFKQGNYQIGFGIDEMTGESSTGFTVTNTALGLSYRVTGSGFTYSAFGYPTTGTMTGATLIDHSGHTVYKATTSPGVVMPNHIPSATELDVIVNSYAYTYNGYSGADKFTSFAQNDVLKGNGGSDYLNGANGNDKLYGGAGNDLLYGDNGNDLLNGGLGRDIMSGGAGNDTFDFNSIAETGITAATRDIIRDFTKGQDKIDLSGIDANTHLGLNQAFHFIGTQGFHHTAGELRFFKIDNAGTSNDMTVVEGDVNGDGHADFQIQLSKLISLSGTDFVL